ncbi:MAG: hypothetical protein GY798_14695 [Hyphomicrobiales bacterium]|nr:hypothetical protein [Hyphomicrobiales bacterium]
MATILTFTPPVRGLREMPRRPISSGQIIVFPGVGSEPPDLDLSQRIRDSIGLGEFDNLAGGGLTGRST